MWRIGLIWLVLLSQTAIAAEIRLAPGKWVGTARVLITVAADGTQSITVDMTAPITVTGGGGVVPPVDPPVDPPTTEPLEKHRQAVTAATAAVSDPNKANTTKALSKLYAALAGLPVTSRDQLVQATDLMFGALGLPQSWTAWKATVDAGLAKFVALEEAKTAWKVTGEAVGVAP